MDLREVVVEPVTAADEGRYQRLMQAHHYLGALPKIGETQWYVARWRREWVAPIGFSAPALKCRARDAWIGWDFRVQYDRLHLVTDNSRFLILPGWHRPNLASRLLSLCERRLVSDWPKTLRPSAAADGDLRRPVPLPGHEFYRASNWLCLGHTRGYRRVHGGYSATPTTPKLVFARPLSPNARARLTKTVLDPIDRHGGPRIMLAADTMRALPMFFADIDDPRRRQGRRHPLPTVLAIATAATLCGMRGYKAMAEWADDLTQRARERFRCRRYDGLYAVPSESIVRNVLVRVDPAQLDRALQRWNDAHGADDEVLAIDGKTLCNAIHQDQDGPCQTPHPQRRRPPLPDHPHPKKVGRLPVGAGEQSKRTNEIGAVIPHAQGPRIRPRRQNLHR